MTKLVLKEVFKEEDFSPLRISREAPFTQSYFYGEWQENLDRKVRRFIIQKDNQLLGTFQVIKYPLAFGKSYLYSPYGPVLQSNFSNEDLSSFIQEIRKISKEEKSVFVRLDFTPSALSLFDEKILRKSLKTAPAYTYSGAYFQPRAEWCVDLTKNVDDLMKSMHQKTRYSVRLSERKGVKSEIVEKNFLDHLEDFYALLSETAERNNFHLHPKSYYEGIFRLMEKRQNCFLSVARIDEKVLVSIFVLCFGDTAHFVFGGSGNEHRNLAPSHLAHWKAILKAKEFGLSHYNFGGVEKNNLYLGWEGLTRFKKGFGGQSVEHSSFYDIVLDPAWYAVYKARKLLKKYI